MQKVQCGSNHSCLWFMQFLVLGGVSVAHVLKLKLWIGCQIPLGLQIQTGSEASKSGSCLKRNQTKSSEKQNFTSPVQWT